MRVKVLAILQARVPSARLPGKVLLPLAGKPMLERQIERIRRASCIDALVVATSKDPADDPIEAVCRTTGTPCHRGSADDVLSRFIGAAAGSNPAWIVRLTADCPLADPAVVDAAIRMALESEEDYDYLTNALQPTYPDGLDVEVMKLSVLQQAAREACLRSEREHVTPFIYKHPERFRIGHMKQEIDLSGLRWTVDELDDYELIQRIYAALFHKNSAFGTSDILALIAAQPELRNLNTSHARNEGYARSLANDTIVAARRYAESEALLTRALRSIPLGSQTFSKSRTQFPLGVSPYFIERGKGSHVWDIDGNEYVDFISGLCAITLGYGDPEVDRAVQEQMENGVIFSLSHPLETEVAEAIIEMVPCAEMVRFGKNGSDATAGAVRLARAHTGRDHIAVCGYHGWQDWYIGSTTRNRGVPGVTRDLTHAFPYNDLPALSLLLESARDKFAAVILEPMNAVTPAPGYLQAVKELCHSHGALLIFDETITGFRFSNGGAQQLFGVIPDLATFGKGLANGYPLSAVTGRADVMRLMDEVFFSFTFGGETLSLAAALATLSKLRTEPVTDTLAKQGGKVMRIVETLIAKHGIGDFLSLSGHPSWSFLNFKDVGPYTTWELKTLFMQEVFAHGVLAFGTHNMSYAHGNEDVARLAEVYDEVFATLGGAVRELSLVARLRCKPIEPLFHNHRR